MVDYKYLNNYPIFRSLTDEELKQVHSITRFKSFDKGMKIFEEGEEGEEMYVLLDGEIEITKPLTLLNNQAGNVNRDNMALIRLKTEDHACVGEMALFGDDDVRSATITAQRSSKFGVIRNVFRDARFFSSSAGRR